MGVIDTLLSATADLNYYRTAGGRSRFDRDDDGDVYGTTGGEVINEDTAFNISPWAAAVRLIANGGAKLPLQVVDPNTGKVLDRNVAWLRKAPCKGFTAFQWKRSAISSLCIRGAAFFKIENRVNGLPDLLRPLASRYVYTQPPHGRGTAQQNNDTSDGITIYYNPTQHRSPHKELRMKEWMGPGDKTGDCLVVRMDDDGSLEGRNPVLASHGILGVALAAQTNANIQFEGGGMPPGVIGLIDADSTEVEQSRSRWKSARRDPRQRQTPVFTNRNLAWIAMQMNANEQQLVESRQFSVQEIARLFNIPLQLLGDPNTTWGTGVHEMVKVMHNSAIDPYTHCLASALSLTLPGKSIAEFDSTVVLYGDPKSRTELLTKAAGGPYMMINEARERARLEHIEGGDIIRDMDVRDPNEPTGTDPDNRGN